MNNQFCILKSKLVNLLQEKTKQRLRVLAAKFTNINYDEMVIQMEKGVGDFHDSVKAETLYFTNKTENVEILLSIDLAEFYFPKEVAVEICFEMREAFKLPTTVTYDDISTNFEKDTPIDCLIKSDTKEFRFQIKRRPQNYLPFTTEAMSEYIKKIIEESYGDMSNIILIIVLQPKEYPEDHFDFNQISKNISIIKSKITFSEINFVFNDENQQLILRQIFPSNNHATKPLVFKSEKYQKIQLESKNKLEL